MEVRKGAAELCAGGAVRKPEARSGDGHVDATARRIAQPLVICLTVLSLDACWLKGGVQAKAVSERPCDRYVDPPSCRSTDPPLVREPNANDNDEALEVVRRWEKRSSRYDSGVYQRDNLTTVVSVRG